MKLNSRQKKLLIALAVILTALVFGWLGGDRIAVVPRENDSARSDNQKPAATAIKGEAIITKVLDGDTVIVSGGDHVRLLGIDADEKGYPCYDAGRLGLEELILGRTVELESDVEDADQYGRKLRYIFLDGENINLKMVAQGLAIARFYPENQKYKDEIVAAEAKAIEGKTGCKWEGRSQN